MYYLYTLIGLSILCSIAATVCAVFYWRNRDGNGAHYYLLAHLAVLLVACFVLLPVTVNYKAALILGFLLSLLALLLHRTLRAPITLVHAFDLLVFLLYMAAFAALHPPKWPTPWLLLPLFVGGLLYWALLPRLKELGGTIGVYAVVLILMIWQALEIVAVEPALWRWLALIGAIGFAVVKAILAIDHAYQHQPSQPRSSTQRPSTQPAWAAKIVQRTPVRLINVVQRSQTKLTQLIERIQLQTLAKQSVAFLPLLSLLCQWLLALSIWGPALGRFTL